MALAYTFVCTKGFGHDRPGQNGYAPSHTLFKPARLPQRSSVSERSMPQVHFGEW